MSARDCLVMALIVLGAAASPGCAATTAHRALMPVVPSKSADTKRPAKPPSTGERIARVAAYTLGHYPKGFRNDCSGYVEAVFSRLGIPIRGSTRMMWVEVRRRGWTHRRRLPKVGDLAFFDDTYDRNRNGVFDDDLSHIAIVLSVEPDGTIELAHAGTSAGRARFRMNLLRPNERSDSDGDRLNDTLRRGTGSAVRSALAAELLRGFATIAR